MKSKGSTFLRSLFLCSAVAVAAGAPIAAQDFYDDIYYDPKTDDKPVQPVQSRPVYADYPAADTYQPTTTSQRDVDEYNRRGIFAVDGNSTSLPADSITDFACTKKIERFYNPDVVVGSSDPTLAQVYYAQPAEVSIIVNNPVGYWGYGPMAGGYGWYGLPSWQWSSWYGTSYWSPGWGYNPYWSWTWGWGGYNPYWGWGWDWAYGPGWGMCPPPRPTGPAHRPYPGNNRHPGALGRPQHGGGHVAGNRPGSGMRPGAATPGRHQGAASQPSTTVSRPGSVSGGFRPGVGSIRHQSSSGTLSRPSNSTNSGGYRPGAVNTSRPATNARPAQTVNRQSTTPTYNRQPSTPSYNRGSSSGGGYRGNSGSRGGGGGGRGRH